MHVRCRIIVADFFQTVKDNNMGKEHEVVASLFIDNRFFYHITKRKDSYLILNSYGDFIMSSSGASLFSIEDYIKRIKEIPDYKNWKIELVSILNKD